MSLSFTFRLVHLEPSSGWTFLKANMCSWHCPLITRSRMTYLKYCQFKFNTQQPLQPQATSYHLTQQRYSPSCLSTDATAFDSSPVWKKNKFHISPVLKLLILASSHLYMLYFKLSCVYCCSCLACIVVSCLVCIVVVVLHVLLLAVLCVLL